MKYTPHKYQEKAIQFLIERSEAGLFLDPGLGKTSISLAAFKILRMKGFVNKLLVIAPLRPCYAVWPAEVKKWDDFKGLSVGILHGAQKEKVLKENHQIYAINPEGMKWLFFQYRGMKLPFDMLVVDESSRFKHSQTQRFKTLKPHLQKFKRRAILTGTPAARSLLDLFGQMYVMDMGKSLGQFVTQYRREFFMQSGYGGFDWVPKPNSEEAIYERISPRVLRMSAEDYLELPELIVEDIMIELPEKAMMIYRQMENVLRLEFKDGKVTAANAAVASMKCRQIANGGIYTDENEEKSDWKLIHSAKTEAVESLIEELEGQPTLIAYEFKHDLERLRKALGKETPYIGGGIAPKASTEIIRRWNAQEIPLLLGQPSSMAHGVNMQEAGKAIIFHSMIWSLEDYDQFIRRIYRQGRKGRVFVYRLIAKGTVDEVIAKSLGKKSKGQNALFQALKEYWSK